MKKTDHLHIELSFQLYIASQRFAEQHPTIASPIEPSRRRAPDKSLFRREQE